MNTRLEIASRLLTLNSYSSDIENALIAADHLIDAEEATRKPEPTITADDSRLAAEIRTFVRELEQGKAPGVAVSFVAQELRIMLERANARRQA